MDTKFKKGKRGGEEELESSFFKKEGGLAKFPFNNNCLPLRYRLEIKPWLLLLC